LVRQSSVTDGWSLTARVSSTTVSRRKPQFLASEQDAKRRRAPANGYARWSGPRFFGLANKRGPWDG